MVGPSLNTHNLSLKPNAAAVKFLCSYGGKILPRYPDGMLRYHGGQTRVLAVDRSISFSGDEPDLSISQDGSKKEGPEESGDYH